MKLRTKLLTTAIALTLAVGIGSTVSQLSDSTDSQVRTGASMATVNGGSQEFVTSQTVHGDNSYAIRVLCWTVIAFMMSITLSQIWSKPDEKN